MLQELEMELSNLIPEATDLLAEDFDFKKNIGIEIKLGEGIIEKNYCNEIDLEVQVIGLFDKKFSIIDKTMEIDKKLNQYSFSNNAWIIHKNAWYTSFNDNEKFNTVLMYTIRNYKERNDV